MTSIEGVEQFLLERHAGELTFAQRQDLAAGRFREIADGIRRKAHRRSLIQAWLSTLHLAFAVLLFSESKWQSAFWAAHFALFLGLALHIRRRANATHAEVLARVDNE